jgi:hypothetical protein
VELSDRQQDHGAISANRTNWVWNLVSTKTIRSPYIYIYIERERDRERQREENAKNVEI